MWPNTSFIDLIGMSPLISTKFTTLLTDSYNFQNVKHEILFL
jgi:hypothetical protein